MAAEYSIYEAKAKLSQIIRMVKQRHCVTITERGTPVAHVIPIESSEGSLSERLVALQAAGQLQPAGGSAKNIGPIVKRRGALRRFLRDRE